MPSWSLNNIYVELIPGEGGDTQKLQKLKGFLEYFCDDHIDRYIGIHIKGNTLNGSYWVPGEPIDWSKEDIELTGLAMTIHYFIPDNESAGVEHWDGHVCIEKSFYEAPDKRFYKIAEDEFGYTFDDEDDDDTNKENN